MVECDFNDEKVPLIPHYDGGGLKIALMEIKVCLPYQQLFCIASCILLQGGQKSHNQYLLVRLAFLAKGSSSEQKFCYLHHVYWAKSTTRTANNEYAYSTSNDFGAISVWFHHFGAASLLNSWKSFKACILWAIQTSWPLLRDLPKSICIQTGKTACYFHQMGAVKAFLHWWQS